MSALPAAARPRRLPPVFVAIALAAAVSVVPLVLPGPVAFGALREADPAVRPALAIIDGGNGCREGGARLRFPRDPGDPPGPPPPPTPAPSPSPGTSAVPGTSPAPAESSPVAGLPDRQFLAARPVREQDILDTRPAQVAPTPSASSSPASPSPIAPTPSAEPASSAPPGATSPIPSPTASPDDSAPLVSGIDISHHNGEIDFQRVLSAGHRFVFMKATQDDAFIDPRFIDSAARARADGIPFGAYHFFDHRTDGIAQADHFLARIELAGGQEGTLPMVVDIECWPPIGTSVHVLSVARLADFVDRVYERTGRLPMVYTSRRMWREVVGDSPDFADLRLWAACWRCDVPTLPDGGWTSWDFWQTGTVRVRGIGRLDGNLFNGTEADLEGLRMRRASLAGGAPFTSRARVRLDLHGLEGRQVRTSVDGSAWSPWRPRREAIVVEMPAVEGEREVLVQARLRPGVEAPVATATIILDRTPPEVGEPTVGLGVGPVSLDGPSAPAIPVVLDWVASDALSGLGDASVAVTCDPGPATGAVAATVATTVPAGADCELRATQADGAGNAASLSGVRVRAELIEAGGTASTAHTVLGQEVAVIAARGPDRGWMRVSVDGEQVAEVDLYAPSATGPEVVFVSALQPDVPQEVTVGPAGRSSPGASSDAVAIDGLAVLRRDGEGE